MPSIRQIVSNWLIPEYPVAVKEIGSGQTRRLVQQVMTVDEDGEYVAPGTGGPGGGGNTEVDAATIQDLVSVTTSNTSVLAANGSRVGGWLRNISDIDIFVSLSATAAIDKPSKLTPGASFPLSGDGWVWTGAVAAIHNGSGSKSLEVVEL